MHGQYVEKDLEKEMAVVQSKEYLGMPGIYAE
jgi:hypothetical protein